MKTIAEGDSLDQIQVLADLAYKLTECVDVRFHGLDSEHELEVQAAELQKSNMLLGGMSNEPSDLFHLDSRY